MLKYILTMLAALMVTASSCTKELETAAVTLAGEPFVVEIADTPEERSRGLMHRRSLDENRGMLFVYDYDSRLSFWMKNTSIPLSIAFIAKDGTIKEIYDMKPFSERNIESNYSVRYALEVNRGTFERLGLEPGDRIDLPEF